MGVDFVDMWPQGEKYEALFGLALFMSLLITKLFYLSTKLKRILFDLAALLKNVLILSPKIKFMHIPILMWTMSHKQLSSRNKSERRIMRLFCAEITHCAHDAHTACMPCEALPCLYSQFPYADLENSQVKNFCLLPPPSLKQGKALNALIQLSVLHM